MTAILSTPVLLAHNFRLPFEQVIQPHWAIERLTESSSIWLQDVGLNFWIREGKGATQYQFRNQSPSSAINLVVASHDEAGLKVATVADLAKARRPGGSISIVRWNPVFASNDRMIALCQRISKPNNSRIEQDDLTLCLLARKQNNWHAISNFQLPKSPRSTSFWAGSEFDRSNGKISLARAIVDHGSVTAFELQTVTVSWHSKTPKWALARGERRIALSQPISIPTDFRLSRSGKFAFAGWTDGRSCTIQFPSGRVSILEKPTGVKAKCFAGIINDRIVESYWDQNGKLRGFETRIGAAARIATPFAPIGTCPSGERILYWNGDKKSSKLFIRTE